MKLLCSYKKLSFIKSMFWQKIAATESSIPDLPGKWKIINICLIQTFKISVSNFSYYHKTFQRKMLKKEGLYKHCTDQLAEYNHFQCSQPYSLVFGWSCGGPEMDSMILMGPLQPLGCSDSMILVQPQIKKVIHWHRTSKIPLRY